MASEELHWRTMVTHELTGFILEMRERLRQIQGLEHLKECTECDAYFAGMEAVATCAAINMADAMLEEDDIAFEAEGGLTSIEKYLSMLHGPDPQLDVDGKPE